MNFTNVPGTLLIGVSFNEWDPFEHAPKIGVARFALISMQRAADRISAIGRNLHLDYETRSGSRGTRADQDADQGVRPT